MSGVNFRLGSSLAVVAMVCGLQVSPALAGQDAVEVDIPVQNLSSALADFTRQTHVQMLYGSATVQGRTSRAVKGSFTPEQVLHKMLEGTGVLAVAGGDGGYTLSAANAAVGPSEVAQLPMVVVTATKTARPIDQVPESVSVITAEDIAQTHPQDLSDVLRNVPGIDVQRSTPTGIATISMRGMGYTHTAVLINGQPADLLSTGLGVRTAIQSIDPGAVERIEVVRGAGSALYGSSAMGGVINIITKQGDPDHPVNEVYTGYDSQHTQTYGGRFSGGAGKVTYNLHAEYDESDGYVVSPHQVPQRNYSLERSQWWKRTVGGSVGVALTDDNDIRVNAESQEDFTNTFGRPNTGAPDRETIYGLESVNRLGKSDTLTASFSYRDHAAGMYSDSYYYPYSTDTRRSVKLDEDAHMWTGELKNQWDITDWNRLLVGGQYTSETARMRYYNLLGAGGQTDDRKSSYKNTAFYAQDELELFKRLHMNFGARYDRFDYDLSYADYTTAPITDRSVTKSWESINPRAGVRYDLTPETSVRGSAGTAFRAPDTYGLMGSSRNPGAYDFAPNPDLGPEKSVNFDLGVDQKFAFGLDLSLTGFYSSIKDLQAVRNDTSGPTALYQFVNVGEATSRGLELELNQQLTSRLKGIASYTYTLARAESDADPTVPGMYRKGAILNLTPRHKAGASLVWDDPDGLTARIDNRWVSRQYTIGDTQNTGTNRLAPYSITDVQATYRFPVYSTELAVTGGISNLFDTTYETRSFGYFEPGRTFYMRLGAAF